MKIAARIRDLVFQHARDRTRHPVRLLPTPDSPEQDATSERAALAAQGVNTVLEVRVPEVALVAVRAGHNSPMRLLVAVDGTLTRTNDGAVLYALSLVQRSNPFEFLAWGANNAQEFRYQLTMLIASLAHDIALKVFAIDLSRLREGPPTTPARENEAAKPEDSGKDQSKPQD
jgi:hypothetical protein